MMTYNGLEVVEVEGKPVALSGWNGEEYLGAFLVNDRVGDTFFEARDDCHVRPVMQPDGDDFVTTGYEFCL